MGATLVDSNVILDVLTEDADWLGWSADALATQADAGPLVINPLIYAEVAARFDSIEDLDAALPDEYFERQRFRGKRHSLRAGPSFAIVAKAASGVRRFRTSISAHTRYWVA